MGFTGDMPGLFSSLRNNVQTAGWEAMREARVASIIPFIRIVMRVTYRTQAGPAYDAWERISPSIDAVQVAATNEDKVLDDIQRSTDILLNAEDYYAAREKYFDSVDECQPLV